MRANAIQYNTILPTGLKPASALASEPCSAHEGCVVVIVPSFFFVDWAIETTRTSPSIPVAFYAQPRAVGPGFEPGSPAYHAGMQTLRKP
jgi:hypothetical protein